MCFSCWLLITCGWLNVSCLIADSSFHTARVDIVMKFPTICPWFKFISEPVCRGGINNIKGSLSDGNESIPEGLRAEIRQIQLSEPWWEKKYRERNGSKRWGLDSGDAWRWEGNTRHCSPKPGFQRRSSYLVTIQSRKRLCKQLEVKVHERLR